MENEDKQINVSDYFENIPKSTGGTRSFSWVHTIGAALFNIIIYFIMIYIAMPIMKYILDLFGVTFIPTRFGGGEDINEPGLITAIIQGIIMNAISAYVALFATLNVFRHAHVKTVVWSFVIIISVWTSLFSLLFFKDGLTILSVILVVSFFLMMLPCYYFAYLFGKDSQSE